MRAHGRQAADGRPHTWVCKISMVHLVLMIPHISCFSGDCESGPLVSYKSSMNTQHLWCSSPISILPLGALNGAVCRRGTSAAAVGAQDCLWYYGRMGHAGPSPSLSAIHIRYAYAGT